MNYFCPLISSRSNINWFVYVHEYSCYKTLCQKHRTTIRKLIKKYGKPLTVSIQKDKKKKSISLFTTHTYWERLEPTIKTIELNLRSKYKNRNEHLLIKGDFSTNAKTYFRTAFKLSGRCAICGSKDGVEMHHERHIRGYKIKQQQGFLAIMVALNRKQIPLCKHHHTCVHKGTYDGRGRSLSELYDTRIAQPEAHILLR